MRLSFTIPAGLPQRSHTQVRIPRGTWPHFTLSDSRLPQPGGPGPRIYIPQEQGGPVISLDTGFAFCRLLRLAGLRWRYSTPPPHGLQTHPKSQGQSYFTTAGLPPVCSSWYYAPWDSPPAILFQLKPCGHIPYVTTSLMRRWAESTELLALVKQSRHGSDRKLLFHYCMFSSCQGNLSTELFPSNGCFIVACLHSCYLALGLHVTIYLKNLVWNL
jgi:hypothetical protein